jgi:hypothetical protein
MNRKWSVTKTLAAMGTVLVWLPILVPIVISLTRLISVRHFNLDYLMPAELFPVVFFGGVLLVWAAVRARSHLALIAWALIVAAIMLFGGQALAVATGLASGETEPGGLGWALVVATLAIYSLAVIAMGAGGILLIRDLWKPRPHPEMNL